MEKHYSLFLIIVFFMSIIIGWGNTNELKLGKYSTELEYSWVILKENN